MTASSWVFPPADSADEHGIVGIGADLEPATILAAYAQGLFPMPLEPNGPIAWWSPDPRAIMPLDMHVSRSLARSMRRFHFTIDTSFVQVDEGELVGGVYGLGIGGLFAGESMFHTETDASKAALVHLTKTLRESGFQLFDVQWMTPHLSSLGAIDLSRNEYLRRLERAVSAGEASLT